VTGMSLEYREDNAEQKAPESHPAAPRRDIPQYSIILLICIVGVTLAQLAFGLDASILAAGFDKTAFTRRHEYWRILTGAALHGSVLHILMNGYALYSIGSIIEMLSNRAHLAIVFLLSAIGGGILSLIFMPEGISVGASGGIVGLIGYLAVYAFRRRQFISPQFRRSLLINIGFILIFGLALYQVIDNFGHIGGLLTGAVYGLVQIPSNEYVDPREVSSLTGIAGLVSLGVFIATSLFSILIIARYI
jgi:membrane associated rhomboid family serine protease